MSMRPSTTRRRPRPDAFDCEITKGPFRKEPPFLVCRFPALLDPLLRRRAPEPVVDRGANSFARDRRHGDPHPIGAGAFVQGCIEPRSRFGEVAARREIPVARDPAET